MHTTSDKRASGACLTVLLLLSLLGGAVRASEEPEAYVITIRGMITDAYAEAVKRKVAWIEERGGKLVIIELDTPGGYVAPCIELADFIFGQKDIRFVAYINPKAYSGGTMVALACDVIYIDSDVGMMGDVAPVGMGGEIASEKQQTVIREKLASYARARGYSESLTEAMVTKEIEVFRIKRKGQPQAVYLKADQLDAMSEEEKADIEQKEVIVSADQLLTMSASRAVEYGFATAVDSKPALYDVLEIDESRV